MSAILTLKKGRDKPVNNRHPWVFSGAIARISGQPDPGDLVSIADNKGRFLARAYFNPHSQIRARILSWNEETDIDESFWRQRLLRAQAAREALSLAPETTAYRLVNAEADGLPGLIVDRYGDFLVMQCLTMGVDRRKQLLAKLLAEISGCAGIFERSDANVRRQEGLEQVTGTLWGDSPAKSLVIWENGHQFLVDIQHGQKSGFYLDQRENRRSVCQPLWVKDREILNVFAYSGGFSVYAAANGAGPIVNVDSAAPALDLAQKNMQLNELSRSVDEYVVADAFQQLRVYRDQGRKFDLIILDPPKFAHSQRDVQRAARGYKDLNWLALRLLRPGGFLATFSCSGLVSADLFQKILFGATVDARREANIIRYLAQSADHPVALTFPESAYLKGFLCHVW